MALAHRQFKDAIYEQFARLGKAMSAPKRLELLDLLCQGPRTVEALADHAALSVANASQHLRILRAARLVDAEKKGLYVEYRISDDEVCRFFVALRGLAEARLAEVDRVAREYFERRGAMEAVELDELMRRVKTGEVTVLDVRPFEEYSAGHIPGAANVPFSQLTGELTQLRDQPKLSRLFAAAGVKPGDTVVTYCHIGMQASLLYLAARRAGLNARIYDGSWEEWSKKAELPIVVEAAKR